MEDQGPLLGISAVERETGLSKDTLRVWERRYGFPNPDRDLSMERIYPADQVEKLKVIRKLLDQGERPRAIVSASMEDLVSALRGNHLSHAPLQFANQDVEAAFKLIVADNPAELLKHLKLALARLGTKQFITEFAVPLCGSVSSAWESHLITINQEHFFSEQIQLVLYFAIANIPHGELERPRILLSTLPNEKHKIGLLMTQAYLSVDGVHCMSLGTETPPQELCEAAKATAADVVGVSFSSTVRLKDASKMLAELRQILDPTIALWAGGGAWHENVTEIDGCSVFASLDEVHAALELWREQQRSSRFRAAEL